MALDAICLQAVVAEVAPQVQGLKIEKSSSLPGIR